MSTGSGKAIRGLAPNYLSMTLVPGFHDIRRFTRDGYRIATDYPYTIGLAPLIEKRSVLSINRTGECSPGAAGLPGRSKNLQAIAPGSARERYKYPV
ncbi:hypothetical protein [Methanoculleus horonobensis]|uniref:hypothetical protein n=1 Tax=Methanoculleus horonobensis TaxID=528314 RepID=UPI0008374A20|nr:hypothetical protein [Methanoculleus horonobensis]MDD3071332.1 hypothetical protein [Methanoculleus horonobensis]MDD4252925.1 hypothetical protein [Methanoculleus horonobensis]